MRARFAVAVLLVISAPRAVSAPADSTLHPAASLARPWLEIGGEYDRAWNVAAAQQSTAATPDSNRPADRSDGSAIEPDVADLPLTEVRAIGTEPNYFALLMTGDGGWAGLDEDVSAELAKLGIPVVGFSSLRYFWTKKAPETAARDVERAIRHYLGAWHKSRVMLIGFSFGADVLPFLVNRFTPDLRARITTVNLLGLAMHASFEVHVADWIPGSQPKGPEIAPELAGLAGLRTLCVYGADEKESLCPQLPESQVTALRLPGGHHFNDDAVAVARHIAQFVGE